MRLTDAEAQLTFSVALFCMAFATLGYGALSDRYGRRPLLLSGLSYLPVRQCRCIPGRLARNDGPRAGRCRRSAPRAASRWFARSRRTCTVRDGLVKAIAYLTMFYTLGPMVSPMVGGLLIDTLGWRSVFGFALLVGSVILTGAYLAIPETRSAERPPPANRHLRSYFELLGQIRFLGLCAADRLQHRDLSDDRNGVVRLHEGIARPPVVRIRFYFLMFPFGFSVRKLHLHAVERPCHQRERW